MEAKEIIILFFLALFMVVMADQIYKIISEEKAEEINDLKNKLTKAIKEKETMIGRLTEDIDDMNNTFNTYIRNTLFIPHKYKQYKTPFNVYIIHFKYKLTNSIQKYDYDIYRILYSEEKRRLPINDDIAKFIVNKPGEVIGLQYIHFLSYNTHYCVRDLYNPKNITNKQYYMAVDGYTHYFVSEYMDPVCCGDKRCKQLKALSDMEYVKYCNSNISILMDTEKWYTNDDYFEIPVIDENNNKVNYHKVDISLPEWLNGNQ